MQTLLEGRRHSTHNIRVLRWQTHTRTHTGNIGNPFDIPNRCHMSTSSLSADYQNQYKNDIYPLYFLFSVSLNWSNFYHPTPMMIPHTSVYTYSLPSSLYQIITYSTPIVFFLMKTSKLCEHWIYCTRTSTWKAWIVRCFTIIFAQHNIRSCFVVGRRHSITVSCVHS